jgi:hypothetical protein
MEKMLCRDLAVRDAVRALCLHGPISGNLEMPITVLLGSVPKLRP